MTKINKHLTESEFTVLDTSPNKLALLEHIKLCPLCSNRFAENLSSQRLLPAPHYLKQNILDRARRQKQKQKEFYTYCVKVVLAVAASLTIVLFLDMGNTTLIENKQLNSTMYQEISVTPKENVSQKICQSTNKLNQKIVDFTDSLFHTN